MVQTILACVSGQESGLDNAPLILALVIAADASATSCIVIGVIPGGRVAAVVTLTLGIYLGTHSNNMFSGRCGARKHQDRCCGEDLQGVSAKRTSCRIEVRIAAPTREVDEPRQAPQSGTIVLKFS